MELSGLPICLSASVRWTIPFGGFPLIHGDRSTTSRSRTHFTQSAASAVWRLPCWHPVCLGAKLFIGGFTWLYLSQRWSENLDPDSDDAHGGTLRPAAGNSLEAQERSLDKAEEAYERRCKKQLSREEKSRVRREIERCKSADNRGNLSTGEIIEIMEEVGGCPG